MVPCSATVQLMPASCDPLVKNDSLVFAGAVTRTKNVSRVAPANQGCQSLCSSTELRNLACLVWPLNKSVSAGNRKTFCVTLFHKSSAEIGRGWCGQQSTVNKSPQNNRSRHKKLWQLRV